tara:strand:- start:12 stop:308 length:297 start_codon:yes stop_codon:yes gene_type:complete
MSFTDVKSVDPVNATDAEYIPVATYPPVTTRGRSACTSPASATRVKDDPEGDPAELENKLTPIVPVPTSGIFLNLPLILLYKYIVFKLSSAVAREEER